jgi:hypothetical protein
VREELVLLRSDLLEELPAVSLECGFVQADQRMIGSLEVEVPYPV